MIHGFACVLELVAELLYILSQTLMHLKLRLIVETDFSFMLSHNQATKYGKRDNLCTVTSCIWRFLISRVLGLFSHLWCFQKFGSLILSGIITLISAKTFQKFCATFPIHFAIGFLCFCGSAIFIYRREKLFINRIIQFRDHDHGD